MCKYGHFSGMLVALLGVAIGSAASFGLTHLVARFLFGVKPRDLSSSHGAAGSEHRSIIRRLAARPSREPHRPVEALRHE
jgi:hypothetical protein